MAVLKDLIVHGASRFLGDSYFNEIVTDEISLRKIKAKQDNTISIVAGLVDVDGELHTKSFTNSNIATIDGNFYITPTITIQGGETNNYWVSATTNSLSFSGASYDLGSAYLDGSDSAIAWSTGSKVVVTGEVLLNNEWIPLGTLKGTLSTYSKNTSPNSIVIDGILDSINQSSKVLPLIAGMGNLQYRKVKVSLISINRSGLKPLGIYMTAAGPSGKTFLDIYGGNLAETSSYDGLSTPVLRIGNLKGLPAINDVGDSILPNGWGIYTSNGFFSGTIVAKQGQIGSYKIDSQYLQSSDGTTGLSIRDDSNTLNWAFWAGGASTSAAKFRVTHDGTLYCKDIQATGGKVGGFELSETQLNAYGTASAAGTSDTGLYRVLIQSTPGTSGGYVAFGVAGRTSTSSDWTWKYYVKHSGYFYAGSGEIASTVKIGGKNQSEYLNSNIEVGGRNLLHDTKLMTSKWYKSSTTTIYNGIASLIGSSSDWTSTLYSNKFDISLYDGITDYILSFEYNSSADCTFVTTIASSADSIDSNTWVRTKYAFWSGDVSGFTLPNSNNKWKKYIFEPRTISLNDLTNGSGNTTVGYFQFYNRTNAVTVQIRNIKFEKGTKATDWTPSPEDIDVHQYVTSIDSNDGIIIKPANGTTTANTSTSNYLRLNSTNGLEFYKAGVLAASYGGSTAQIGYASGKNIVLDSEGVKIRNGNSNTSTLALYGSTTKFYKVGTTTVAAEIGSNGLSITNGTIDIGNGNFQVSTEGSLISTSGTIGGWTINGNVLSRTVSSTETIDNESISGGTDSDGSSTDSSTNVTITSTVTLDDNGIIFNGTYNGNPVRTSVQPTGVYSNSFYRTSGYSIYQALNLTGVNLYCFGNNKEILRFASKTTAVNPSSKQGLSFMIGNGYYTVGSGDNHEVKSDNLNMYLCGGTDETSKFIRSYPTYKRTYPGYSANVFITDLGTFGRITSSSIRYKHDVEYITNENKSVIDDSKKILKKVKDDSNIYSVLDIPLVNFKYNKGYITGEADFDYNKSFFGVIADDIASICPECATYIKDENGNNIPESYNINQITFRMLYVIQQQEKRIKELENTIIKLKEK